MINAIGLMSRVFANGLRCGSYWKGSLWVTLDEGRQLYFYFTYFHGLNKGFGSKFCVGSQVQH